MRIKNFVLSFTLAAPVMAFAASPLTGTPIGTGAVGGHGPEAMFDGKSSTYFEAYAENYAWGGLDFGEPYVIKSISLTPRAGAGQNELLLAIVQGANNADFSDALPIAMVTSVTSGSVLTLDVECSRGFRYVRYVGPAGSHARLAEMSLIGDRGEGDDSHLWQITNLPTVVVNTVNSEEPYDKEHEITGNIMIVSENGAELLDKPGTIRERGNASRQFPKKPWRLKFDKKTNVLDSPAKAKKWTLINNYGDKTLMRNILAFETARKFGMEYVPFCRPVDVVLNGEYKGCYQLCDQVEVNPGRVEIDEMEPDDTDGENLTGGYFVEIDGYADQEISWFRSAHYGIPVTIKSPKDDEIVAEQRDYIVKAFNELETSLKSVDGSYDASDPVTGYRRLLDTRSFITHMLVNEVAGNTDCYWSTYMYKRRNDPKFYTGPVWDFDLGFNNDSRTYRPWEKSNGGFLWNSGLASLANGMRYFAQRVITKDPTSAAEIASIWKEYRDGGFSAGWLTDLIDSTADELDKSQRLNFMRWPILNSYVHMNPQVAGSYEGELQVLRTFVEKQIEYLDGVIGYEATDPVEPDKPQDGIDTPAVDTGIISVAGRSVVTAGFGPSMRYSIFGIDGRYVSSGLCNGVSRSLAHGIYIVRIDGTRRVEKIVIR